jgi:deoxyribodipyrimidine photo-lyase
MQAGVVGINTVRLYSPDKQLQDHDPKGSFVYKWCPELRDISPSRLAKHASLQVVNYPSPLAEYTTSSKIMISEIYKRKKSALGFEIAKEVYRRHGSRSKKSAK